MTYQELKAEENKYVMNTYGRFPIALDHGEGATVWDVEGKKYIDLGSGIGVNCMGYNNQTIIDAIDVYKRQGFINLFGLPLKVRALNDQILFNKTGKHFPSVEK